MSSDAPGEPDDERGADGRASRDRPDPGPTRVVPLREGWLSAVPGLRAGAPRRNVLVALAVLLVLAVVGLAWLGGPPP